MFPWLSDVVVISHVFVKRPLIDRLQSLDRSKSKDWNGVELP